MARPRKVQAEEINQDVVVPVEDGEVIGADVEETTIEAKADTVVVCSNHPMDIKFILKDSKGNENVIIIKGNAHNLKGKEKGVLPLGGAYGITANVPADAWEQIKTLYADAPYIKNGLMFVSTPTKARLEAKERKDLRNGFEPIDPMKTQTKENV